jgi:hypothetical protein
MTGILCTLSDKRLSQLREDPDLVEEILAARLETVIPGLLDIGKTWDVLDLLLSDRGKDAIMGDAILGRTGKSFGPSLSFGRPKLLSVARVSEISNALNKLSESVIEERYGSLNGKTVHGGYGQAKAEEREAEIDSLTSTVVQIKKLYAEAAAKKHAILLVVV